MHIIQQKLLDLAKAKKLDGLSLRSMGKLVGVDAPQQIKHHLIKLEKEGYIEIDTHKRQIIPLNSDVRLKPVEVFQIPLITSSVYVSKNFAFNELNTNHFINMSSSILPKKDSYVAIETDQLPTNAVRFYDIYIESGDIVIIDYNHIYNEGDYVLTKMNNTSNIKLFARNYIKKQIILYSESDNNFDTLILDEERDNPTLLIKGKVVLVVKRPRIQKQKELLIG